MTRKFTKLAAASIVCGALATWGCNNNPQPDNKPAEKTIGLPQDVLVSCPVPQETFNTWFAGGKATENGFVLPANSVAFTGEHNCDFYKWSEQMFLWITSPNPAGPNSFGKTVLESDVFYDVSPADANGQRTLTQHDGGKPLRLTGHLRQTGPNDLPVIKDKEGRLFEVESRPVNANAKAMVRNSMGKPEMVDHVEEGADGAVVFKNAAGNAVEKPKAVIQHPLNRGNIVQEFIVKGSNRHIFLDSGGRRIETEAGQATGNVLRAQNGSLVYYISMVNDVYAYFLTGGRDGKFKDDRFPTRAEERDSICAFARANNKILLDSNALAMELKTSWVEAKGLRDENSYVTIEAFIPTYDTTNPHLWTPIPGKDRKVKLALVGMHVVGSTAKHPEMIWATFEHQDNAPNASYPYVDVNNKIQRVPQDIGSRWLFSANARDTAPNISRMSNDGETIYGNPISKNSTDSYAVSASNTLLVFPFGADSTIVPNPGVTSAAASNSEVISLNNAVRKMLGKDVRRNYVLIGATWTGGGAPNQLSYPANKSDSAAVGTSLLANSTMETDFQTTTTSCLYCHSGTLDPNKNHGLSHIFSQIIKLKLPEVPKSMKK